MKIGKDEYRFSEQIPVHDSWGYMEGDQVFMGVVIEDYEPDLIRLNTQNNGCLTIKEAELLIQSLKRAIEVAKKA